MENRPVTLPEFEGRKVVEDERFRRDKERLDKQEATLDRVADLTVQMGEMLKRHDEKLGSHETRLSALEKQPAEAYGKVKTAIVTALISGFAGWFLNQVVGQVRP